jgi:hypothetical protein
MSNQLKTRNGIPFDFVDGLRIKGVDVTNLEKIFTPAGAGLIGFTPVGGVSANNVQGAIAQVDTRLSAVETVFSPGEDYGLLTTAVTATVDYGSLL